MQIQFSVEVGLVLVVVGVEVMDMVGDIGISQQDFLVGAELM
jgi:hypothetical protein